MPEFPKVKDIKFVFEDGSEARYYWSIHCDSFIKGNAGDNMIDPDAVNQIFNALKEQDQLEGYP